MIPRILWLVGIRYCSGKLSSARISGPLEQVCAAVSAQATITVVLGTCQFRPNDVWARCMIDISTSTVGGSVGGCLLNSLPDHKRCGMTIACIGADFCFKRCHCNMLLLLDFMCTYVAPVVTTSAFSMSKHI